MPSFIPTNPSERFEQIGTIITVYYSATVHETLDYIRETAGTLSVCLLLYVLLCFFVYFLLAYWSESLARALQGQISTSKRVMFVIAHPDDECMFFGPTVIKLAQQKECKLYLLCLSKGDFEEKGSKRKQELWKSCRLLGIPESNITIIMSGFLPDDPKVRWQEDILGTIILNQIETLNIDTVITFDKHGVSRHANHCALFYAVALLCMEKKMPSYCKAYALESVSIARKYFSLLDAPLLFLTSSYSYVTTIQERQTIKRAMEAHASQLVWFRSLYLLFSRYLFINTLQEIELPDLELDLELNDTN